MPRKKLDGYKLMPWYRAIWLGCDKATFLLGKKEEGQLTLKENIQLRLHLRICSFCTRFQKQVQFFTKNAMHTHEHLPQNMREEKKVAIKGLLKD